MIFKSLAFVLVVLAVKTATAIQCDFKYQVDNDITTKPSPATSAAQSGKPSLHKKKQSLSIFDCEDPNDNFETITGVKPMGFDTRFGDDEYEPASSDCVSIKKTIQPKALNNIYNQLMNVVNNATFVQSIEIDECGNKNEPCNSGNEPPPGKKLLCRQKFVKVNLKAFKDDGDTVDEQFYYPSHCICELVQRKRSV